MEKATKYYEEQTEDIKQVFNKNGVEHTVKIMLFEYSKALQKENQELREDYQKSTRLNAQLNIRYVELEDEKDKWKQNHKDLLEILLTKNN